MSAKTKKLTYGIIALFVCGVIVVASLIALVNLKQAQNNHDVRRGPGIGERQFQLVDNSLINYVNLTTTLIQREGAHPFHISFKLENITYVF
jgi:hypothetical protein